jgi:hypothetical protein
LLKAVLLHQENKLFLSSKTLKLSYSAEISDAAPSAYL